MSGSAVHFMQQNTKQFIHLEIHGKLSGSRRHRLLVVSRHGETMTSVRATQYLLFLSKEQCTSWSQYAGQLREGQKTNSKLGGNLQTVWAQTLQNWGKFSWGDLLRLHIKIFLLESYLFSLHHEKKVHIKINSLLQQLMN